MTNYENLVNVIKYKIPFWIEEVNRYNNLDEDWYDKVQ